MYSPQIKQDLIPILYKLAKEKNKPMTNVVDEILRPVLVDFVESLEIPYCASCLSVIETDGKQVTAYCDTCEAESFVLYKVPTKKEAV